jgi:hypothetical protein
MYLNGLLENSGLARTQAGGDGGIRTLGKVYTLRRFSKPLVSATHPRLHANWQDGAIAVEFDRGNGYSAYKYCCHAFRDNTGFDSFWRVFDSGHRPFIVSPLSAALEIG